MSSTIKVYEEGSDEDPIERLYSTYIDWISQVQTLLSTFDEADFKRCLAKVSTDTSRAGEILRLEMETSQCFRIVREKMEASGATQWCLYHDCDATQCPPKSHFWCSEHDCPDDECPEGAMHTLMESDYSQPSSKEVC